MADTPLKYLNRRLHPMDVVHEFTHNPANYKPCRMKSYTMRALISDKMLQVTNYYYRNKQFGVATITHLSPTEPVLIRGIGDMWEDTAISISNLCKNFVTSDGEHITAATLKTQLSGAGLSREGWTKVIYKPSTESFVALCIPAKYKDWQLWVGDRPLYVNATNSYNSFISKTAAGDFIVCPVKKNGEVDFFSAFVIQGDLFFALFDNRGWTDCLLK